MRSHLFATVHDLRQKSRMVIGERWRMRRKKRRHEHRDRPSTHPQTAGPVCGPPVLGAGGIRGLGKAPPTEPVYAPSGSVPGLPGGSPPGGRRGVTPCLSNVTAVYGSADHRRR